MCSVVVGVFSVRVIEQSSGYMSFIQSNCAFLNILCLNTYFSMNTLTLQIIDSNT